jgi:hypothetical protein
MRRVRNQRENSWQAEQAFRGLYGVISQKMVLFVSTAVRTSNPTGRKFIIFTFSFLEKWGR